MQSAQPVAKVGGAAKSLTRAADHLTTHGLRWPTPSHTPNVCKGPLPPMSRKLIDELCTLQAHLSQPHLEVSIVHFLLSIIYHRSCWEPSSMILWLSHLTPPQALRRYVMLMPQEDSARIQGWTIFPRVNLKEHQTLCGSSISSVRQNPR